MSLTPSGLPEPQTTTKIQVGPDVWIRPNLGQSVPEYGVPYFAVWTDGEVVERIWNWLAVDYAFLQSGNFFLTREAAEQAIIKPVDPTPITYKQWVDAGRPKVLTLHSGGELMWWPVQDSPVVFSACKCWLTREAAQAWLDQWERENGEVK